MEFSNKKTVTQKKEFLKEFDCHVRCDKEMSEENISMLMDILSEYYDMMYSQTWYKYNIDDVRYMVMGIAKVLYLRLYGFLTSPVSYLKRRAFVEKMAKIAYMRAIYLISRNNDMDKTELIESISDYIDTKYFGLIEKIKDVKTFNLCKLDYLYVIARHCLWSITSIENIIRKAIGKVKYYYKKYFAIFMYILAASGVLVFILSNFIQVTKINMILLTIFSLLLLINLIYFSKIYKNIFQTYMSKSVYSSYYNLGVDVMSINVSENLIPYADPEKKNGKMLYDIAKARTESADDLGYVFPHMRILDYTELKDNELLFLIRDKEVKKLKLYMNKYVVQEAKLKLAGVDTASLEEADTIFSKNRHYWVDKNIIKNMSKTEYLTHREFFKKTLKEISLKYLDEIFTAELAYIYYSFAEKYLIKNNIDPMTVTSLEDMRDILLALLKERISIKDYRYVLERIYTYASRGCPNATIIQHLKDDLKIEPL